MCSYDTFDVIFAKKIVSRTHACIILNHFRNFENTQFINQQTLFYSWQYIQATLDSVCIYLYHPFLLLLLYLFIVIFYFVVSVSMIMKDKIQEPCTVQLMR